MTHVVPNTKQEDPDKDENKVRVIEHLGSFINYRDKG